MMEQRIEDYRAVLEDLARSRGLEGAEELARRVAEADPDYTERDILEANMPGVGDAVDKVLNPPSTEEERMHIAQALARTPKAKKARGLCPVPGCARPNASSYGCKEHRRAFDAQAEEEAWDLALSILRPWMEATHNIGSDELTRVMQLALDEAEREFNLVLDEREAAEAALKAS